MRFFMGKILIICTATLLAALTACKSEVSVTVTKGRKLDASKTGGSTTGDTTGGSTTGGSTDGATGFSGTSATVSGTTLTSWFGSVATGTTYEKMVTLNFANLATDVTNIVITLPTHFAFVGGAYPGTGGTCGSVISTSSCTLNINFSPPSVANYDGNMTVSFDHDGIRQNVPVPLRGEGGLILGDSSFAVNLGTQYGLNQPTAIGTIGSKYFIVDSASSRVKIYNSVPTAAVGTPDIVLGQGDNYGIIGAIGSNVNAGTLNTPMNADYCGGKFFVSDTTSNRVLIWNSIPTTTGQSADLVLGQTNFTNVGTTTFNKPRGIACYTVGSATMLFVADSSNNRVLAWNNLSTIVTGQAADQVLGQANFTTKTANRGSSVNNNTLSSPTDVEAIGDKLFVADQGNNRVIVFPLPTTDTNLTLTGVAEFTLGQGGSFTSATAGPGSNRMNSPAGIATNGTGFSVAENAGNRVLIWNAIPTAHALPNVVLGQADFTTVTGNNTAGSGNIDAKSLSAPRGVAYVGTRFHVADTNNDRVLVYNTIPASNHLASDFIIGQISAILDTVWSHPTIDGTMVSGTRVYADNNRLIMPDPRRHRVLIWNTFPTSNNQPADVVLGQASFTSGARNRNGTPTCGTMSSPSAVWYDGSKLYVADQGNHRVLVWDSLPSNPATQNGLVADRVIGQADCTTVTATTATGTNILTSTNKMNTPVGVYVVSGTLFITEQVNDRILAYTTSSIAATNDSADFVLGASTGAECFASSSQIGSGQQVYSDGSKLYIPDKDKHRVLVYNTIPTSRSCFNYVLGQTTDTGVTTANNSPTNFGAGAAFDGDGNLYMIVVNSMRIEKFAPTAIPTATGLFGSFIATWGGQDDNIGYGMYKNRLMGGYGYTNTQTPAIVGNLMIVPDYFGRVYIVPKP